MGITIQTITFHRNGVAGRSFWGVEFSWTDDDGKPRGRMFASVPCKQISDIECYVIDLDDPAARWRGDAFYTELRDAINREKGADSV